MMFEFESILDTPKEGLDPAVWKWTDEGGYVLTDEAHDAVKTLVEFVKECFDLESPSVRIIGSITSNQYSSDSDIDVHFTFDGLNEGNQEEFNRILRAEFEENFKDMHTDKMKVGDHPLEVYFQANPYQDLMSVGCYDFIQKMWLVGPDLKPMDFDPYSEFYSEDMKYVKDVIKDIRSNILECYEAATVILNSSDEDFRASEFQALMDGIKRGAEIFNAAKQCRKAYSAPRSVEDAIRKRESRKWKIADSAFKLMDKFGYLKILKSFSRIAENPVDAESVALAVLRSVGDSIRTDMTIDESLKDMGKFFLIASLLAIPGILPADAVAKTLQSVPKAEFRVDSQAVQKSLADVSTDKGTYGGYSASDVVNMVARTLYVEGGGEGTEGRKAILSVIMNRAGNDRNNIAPVIKERAAFSCWRKMTDSDWEKFVYRVPQSVSKNRANQRIWKECVDLATQLFMGKFKSTIGNRNSYLNPKKANTSAVNSWGKKMDLVVKNHKFGYLKEHDPKFVFPGTMTPRTAK